MRLLFLSHSSADKEHADTLSKSLAGWGYESRFVYWDAADGIPGGTDWTRELYRQLHLTGALIAIYSQQYVDSKWCFAELTAARMLGKPVIPLRVGGATVPLTDLQTIQAIDYDADAAGGFPKLQRALREASLSALDDFAPDPNRPPYPGLAAFEEGDAASFCGRQPELAAIMQTLQRIGVLGDGGLLLIAGASGSGKSSLLRAGILPRLGKVQPGRWLVLPAIQPRHGFSIVADFCRALGCASADRDVVLARIDDLARERNVPGARAVLSIDQLEQLFVEQPPPDTPQFLALLASLASRPSPIVIIGVLRSDFLDRFQTHERIRDLEFDLATLGLMPSSRFVEIIQGPADVYGLKFEPPTLPQRIAGEAGSDEALPLVAFALRALWEPARHDGVIRESLYESLFGQALGGISGAVARAGGQILGSLEPDERRALQRAFVQLVRFDVNDKPVRRQARWSELPAASHKGLEKLIDARLLTSRGEGHDRFVDVAHESLFRVWPDLAGWIKDDHAFHSWRRNLTDALQLWTRDDASVLKGKALLESERWLKDRAEDLTDQERRFITRSVAARTKETRRKYAWVGVALTGLAIGIAAVIYMMYAEIGRQRELAFRSLIARARAARAEAVDGREFSGDLLNRSLLLAVEAARQSATPEAIGALQEGLAAAHRGSVQLPVEGETTLVALSDGGRYVARLHPDGAEVIEVDSKKAQRIPMKVTQSTGLFWAAEAPILLIASTGELRAWDAANGRQLWTAARDPDSECPTIMSVSLEASGRYVASTDGAVATVRELASGHEVFSTRQPEPLCIVALSPGARYLALSNLERKKGVLVDRMTGRASPIPVTERTNLMSFAFDSRGRQIVVVDASSVDLWDVDAGRMTFARNISSSSQPTPIFARFGEDGGTVAVQTDDYGVASSISLRHGAPPLEMRSMKYALPIGFMGKTVPEGFSVWDLTNGRRVANLLLAGEVKSDMFAFDAHDGRIAFADGQQLSIYDTQGAQQLERFRAPAGSNWTTVDAGRRFAIVARDSTVVVVDTDTLREVSTVVNAAPADRTAVDPAGTRAAVLDKKGTLTVWSLRERRALWKIDGIPLRSSDDGDIILNVRYIGFSDDGAILRVVAHENGGAWTAASGTASGPLPPVPEGVMDPTVPGPSPDGLWSLAVSDDKADGRRTVLVRDRAKTVFSRIQHDSSVVMTRFSADGRTILTATDDGVLRAWLWKAADLIDRACKVVSRPALTADEWTDAFGTAAHRPTCDPRSVARSP